MNYEDLFTAAQLSQLRANSEAQREDDQDRAPVAWLILVDDAGNVRAEWLLSELDSHGVAFALCNLGFCELGYVDLNEVIETSKSFDTQLRLIQLPFEPAGNLGDYANASFGSNRIKDIGAGEGAGEAI